MDHYVPDEYIQAIDVSKEKNGFVMEYLIEEADGTYSVIVSGNGSGYIKANPDSTRLFGHFSLIPLMRVFPP